MIYTKEQSKEKVFMRSIIFLCKRIKSRFRRRQILDWKFNSLKFIECDEMQVTNGNIKMEELIYHLQIHFNFMQSEFKRKYWIFF